MPFVFSVRVSGDPACRALAADVAKRYFELAGAPPAEADTRAVSVAAAVDEVAVGEREIDLTFSRSGAVVAVEIACGNRRERREFDLT